MYGDEVQRSLFPMISSKYLLFGLTICMIVAFWIFQIPTLSQALIEAHGFRQTQTAYQSLTLSQGFGSLLHPKLPIYGSPWEVPFEFPLFQYSAAILIRFFHLSSDVSNRLASLLWFTMCLIPLWLIVRRWLGAISACGAILIFTLSPFAIQWSRASLIEYCALFFGLSFVFFFIENWRQFKFYSLIGAVIAGSLCGLVKSTTLLTMVIFLLFLIPDIFGTLSHFKKNLKRTIHSLVIVLPVFAATAWWTHHADQIKQANPGTRWLTSSGLQSWNFGTLEQRLNIDNWLGILGRIDSLILPRYTTVALLLLPVLIYEGRQITLAAVASIALTVAIFFNLYIVHDYYLVALTPQLAILLVVSVQKIGTKIGKAEKNQIFILVLLFAICLPLYQSKSYWKLSRAHLTYSHELKTLTKPNQFIIYGTNSWDPTGLYYSERKGMMMDSRGMTAEILAGLPDLKSYDFYHGPMERFDLIEIRGWYAPVGSATIRIDDIVSDFGPIGVIFSVYQIEKPARQVQKMVCNGEDLFSFEDYPIGTYFKTASTGTNYFQKQDGIIPVPVGQSAIKVKKPVDAPPQTVSCIGGGTVTFSVIKDSTISSK